MTEELPMGEDLETSVRRLVRTNKVMNSQLEDIKAQLRRRTVAFFTAIAAGCLVLGFAVNAAYQVSLDNRAAIKANNAKFCPIILGLAPLPGDAPPAGTPKQQERSNRIRETFAGLASDPDFGCR